MDESAAASDGLRPDLTEAEWRRLDGLFQVAVELSAEDRESFIARETVGDPETQCELRAMLEHSEGARNRIASAVERAAGRLARGPDWIGRRFGPYQVVREIGRGGMGLVFEACRYDAEYEKRVALKVAPDWRDLERLRERFRNERQILASLEHPNIARFLDGGSDDGLPYFVMEYIDGKPVTQWAREHDLGVREKIGLFRQICAAVSYAHENLVIHRDLKPANILVDQNGTPKLLDFGIATLLRPIPEEGGTTTGTLWTPDYTSPEQVRGSAVTVRTDIYSLGLILYELLCGERAQPADTSSPLALDRSICETEPLPPSARVAAPGEKSLSRQLRGDLDTIVAMAIRKEPERRYPSVAALDADLARYLDGRAVDARPSTVLYRLSKAIRRHWVASVAVAAVTISVAGGVGATLYQARRAERRFEQVRSLANAFVFDVHDRIQYLPGATEARKSIVSTALIYLENLEREAGGDLSLRRDLAADYERVGDVQGNPFAANLGDSRGAMVSYRHAESLLLPLAWHGDGAANRALTSTTYKLASLQHVLGDPAAAVQIERAQQLARRLIAEQPENLEALGLAVNIDTDLARYAADARSPKRSLEAALEAAGIAARMVKLQPSSEKSRDFLALAQTGLAVAYRASGNLELAAQAHRDSLAIREQLVAEHPDNVSYRRLLLLGYGHLGDALGLPENNGLGRLPESVDAFQKATAIAEWIAQHDPSDRNAPFNLIVANMRTASALLEEGDAAAEALTHLTKVEPLLSRLLNADPSNQRDHMYALILDYQMGKALSMLGRYTEADRSLERARSAVKGFQGTPSETNARSTGLLATMRLAQVKASEGDEAASLSLANEAANSYSRSGLNGNPWSNALFSRRLGSIYSQIRQPHAARLWLEKSAALWRAMSVPKALEPQRRKALASVEHDLEDL